MVRRSITAFRAFVIGCIAISGAIVAAQNPGGSPEARKMRNPVPPTAASIKSGALLYQKNCEFCHGPKGLGDGRLVPKDVHPANLTDTEWVRGSTDGEIFAVIANGAGPEFKMKGVKARLSETDIWHLVNYVRSLGPKNGEH